MAALIMEICVDSLASVSSTIEYGGGGNRYEVCSNLVSGGGLTPSYGLVKAIRSQHPDAKLMIMIRPRVGSFVYSPEELAVMQADITSLKELGVMGFVFGCLNRDGHVDEAACRILLDAAAPLPVTFHRAFDVTTDWRKAFETIVRLRGFKRILTSGQASAASQGLDLLAQLMDLASQLPPDEHIAIVAAAGVNPRNIPLLKSRLPRLAELHLTGSNWVVPPLISGLKKGEVFGFGTGEEWKMDPDRIKAVWEQL